MAKPVTVTVSHELGREAAKERIAKGFDQVASSISFGLSMEQTWQDDTMHFSARALGQSITGTVEPHEENVTITVVLPGLLAGMAETIQGKLKKESQILLEKK